MLTIQKYSSINNPTKQNLKEMILEYASLQNFKFDFSLCQSWWVSLTSLKKKEEK